MNLRELVINELTEFYAPQQLTSQLVEQYEKDLQEGKIPVSDYIDLNTDDSPVETEADEKLANELFAFIQDIIDSEATELEEDFTSPSSLKSHYVWHCLAGRSEDASTYKNIFYDFRDMTGYKELEKDLSHRVLKAPADGKTSCTIFSLLDTDRVLDGFRNLFGGNYILTFAGACGFKNAVGHVSISFISFANDYTKNYKAANTIHCLVTGRNSRTITLYLIDAYRVENRFNSFIVNYNKDKSVKFKINH